MLYVTRAQQVYGVYVHSRLLIRDYILLDLQQDTTQAGHDAYCISSPLRYTQSCSSAFTFAQSGVTFIVHSIHSNKLQVQ
jgi:hypothetical protein